MAGGIGGIMSSVTNVTRGYGQLAGDVVALVNVAAPMAMQQPGQAVQMNAQPLPTPTTTMLNTHGHQPPSAQPQPGAAQTFVRAPSGSAGSAAGKFNRGLSTGSSPGVQWL